MEMTGRSMTLREAIQIAESLATSRLDSLSIEQKTIVVLLRELNKSNEAYETQSRTLQEVYDRFPVVSR